MITSNADKGGAVVIQDVKSYKKKLGDNFQKKNYYTEISYNATAIHKKLIDQTIETFKKERLLKENVTDGLNVENPRTPKFYTSPKTSKLDNLGRSVMTLVNSLTSKISEYADYHLQPLMKTISLHVKDTNNFLNKMKDINEVPEDQVCQVSQTQKAKQQQKEHLINKQITLLPQNPSQHFWHLYLP